jgi:hypothetical protein
MNFRFWLLGVELRKSISHFLEIFGTFWKVAGKFEFEFGVEINLG